MNISIRKAEKKDSKKVISLLYDIAELHRKGRPDLFRKGKSKYTEEEFCKALGNEDYPIFVAVNDNDEVIGYSICKVNRVKNHPIFNDYVNVYIDDLCVDSSYRGNGVGATIVEYVKKYAKEIGAYDVDLNVWEFNKNAMKFYEKCGLVTYRRRMEYIVK